MFVGTYQHTVDDKGRLTLPAKWRNELAEGVVITRGIDRCLYILPKTKFDGMAKDIDKQGLELAAARAYGRHFSGMADLVEPDKQGRIIIPQNLRNFAGLDGEVTVVGVISRIEVWNPSKHKEIDEQIENDVPGVAEHMGSIMRGAGK